MSGLRSIKLIGGFVLILFIMGLFSCSKKPGDTETSTGEGEVITVSENDFTETDEDLLTVDYKEFYDELAPHGEWIEVTDKEIGVDMKGTASGESPIRKHRSISFSDLFGVKEANAYDAAFGAFFVWKPSPNLAVGLTAGETTIAEPVYYQPYTNGQWINTEAGWYFQAATPVEEVTHHYGRWVHSPAAGWVWVPGRVWAPAWVDWREEGDYIAWTPIAPSVYIVNNVIAPPPVIVEERYIVVEKRYFVEPMVYQHVYWHHRHPGKFKIKEWRRLEGVMVVNNTIIDRGPDVSIIQTMIGRDIPVVRIDRVSSINSVEYTGNVIKTYSPEFKKVKEKGNRKNTFTKPEKYNTFSTIQKDNKNESSGKQNDNSLQNNNKTRLSDDGNMKNGKNNNSQSKGNDNKGNNNTGKNNRGNDNVKEKKGNDNKGNDKGNNRGNDNKGKDNKGNDDKGKKKLNSNTGKDNNSDNGNNKRERKNDNGKKDRVKENSDKNKGSDNKGNSKGDNKSGNNNNKGKR
jgi:hypothetical protein